MVVIINALRTPIGKLNGKLKDSLPEDLVSTVIKNNLALASLDQSVIDEIILGQSCYSNINIAQLASLKSDIPIDTPAYSIQMLDASGIQSVLIGALSIMSGKNEVVIAGGVETVSQSLSGVTFNKCKTEEGNLPSYDLITNYQLNSKLEKKDYKNLLGITTEDLINKYNISRKEQDNFSLSSQRKAKSALEYNVFSDEVVPIDILDKQNKLERFIMDELPIETSLDTLSGLKPKYIKDGTITEGNSSKTGEGASMLLMMSKKKAKELNIKPMAQIKSFEHSGTNFNNMEIGSIRATKKALLKQNLGIKDLNIIELSELFAAQSIMFLKEFGIYDRYENYNVNGGEIALGNPLGCTGSRMITTLVHQMRRDDLRYGLVSSHTSSGQGVSVILENVN